MSVLMVSAPALAQSGQASSGPVQTAKAEKPKKICQVEEETGTRLGRKRTCRTAEEWDQIRAESRQQLEKSQQQNVGVPSSGGF